MTTATVDAVVIGSGPNGLVAANVLADAGWEVVVLEAAPTPGGAVRTAELTVPGFHHDVFSAFYPFAVASPAIRQLALEDHGLVWKRPAAALAHPTPDGPTALLATDPDETAASLDLFAPGDGERWRDTMALFDRVGDALVDALMLPFPPVRPAVRMFARLGVPGLREFVRMGLLPVNRMGDERFRGEGGKLLLAGLALHADLAPDSAASGFYGWLLAGLAEVVGFPVPEGGAGELAHAMVRRLSSRGGELVCDAEVTKVLVEDGAAVGVVSTAGEYRARRAVLADVGAPALYQRLVGFEHLPPKVEAALSRFERSAATVKVDWALDSPIPWSDPAVARAGTVHIADSLDELTEYSYHLATRQLPRRPFLLSGQMTNVDPTRSPAGTETFWAYTHVPQRPDRDAAGELDPTWDDKTRERFADRMEDRIEERAPGFRDRIVGRHILAPPDFETWNANLVGGDTNGGTAQVHQQLIWRPIPGLGRAETPIDRLYLASASAHPGGGVHGAPGNNAARAALAHDRADRAWRAVQGAATDAFAKARAALR